MGNPLLAQGAGPLMQQPAPSPMPSPMQPGKPTASANPLTAGPSAQMFNFSPQPRPQATVNPLLKGVASFAEGFAPEQFEAGRQRSIKAQDDGKAREREQLSQMLTEAKAWTEKGLSYQDDAQLQQFFLQNADNIARTTGQDIRQSLSGGINRAALQQQLSGIDAMLQGMQAPEAPKDPRLFQMGNNSIVSVGQNQNPEVIYNAPDAPPKPVQPNLPDGWMMGPDGQPKAIEGYDDWYKGMHAKDGAASQSPSGFRPAAGGGLEPIPGGPADPKYINMKSPGGLGPNHMSKAQIQLEQQFAKNWKGIQANYNDISQQYKIIDQMGTIKTPAGDLALVVGFTKMLDPGSVAREGEVKLTQSAASLLAQVQNYLPRLQQGNTLLPDGVREQYINAAKEMLGVYEGTFDNLAVDYQKSAQDYGFDTQRAMPGYRPGGGEEPKHGSYLEELLGQAGPFVQKLFGGGQKQDRTQPASTSLQPDPHNVDDLLAKYGGG